MAGTNSEENEAPLGLEAREEENGEEASTPHSTLSLGERRELSQRGPGMSPRRKRFYYDLISDRLR